MPLSAMRMMICVLVCVTGCTFSTFRANNDDLPGRYKVEAEHVVLHSDVKLKGDDPLIDELKELRQQISQTLELPVSEKQVEVYLFESEKSYHKFLSENYPGLPPRRAYFVGTSAKLAVYTVWTERIREDLRHEFTHGVLHGALKTVPLWLDEGLAEYFELPQAPGVPRADYLQELSLMLKQGWSPNLQRLEQLDEVNEMRRLDYAEAWAWVHWMLHTHPETRQMLLSHISEGNRTDKHLLSAQIPRLHSQPEVLLRQWITTSSGNRQ